VAESAPRKGRTRGNRDGKPYQRKADGKWVAVGYFPNGKRKPCYGATSKEAAEKRKQFYRELEAQVPITVGNTLTVEIYLRQWIEVTLAQRVKAGRLAEGTFGSYRDNVELHIVPHIGRIKMVELGTSHIRTWLLLLADKPSGRGRRVLRPGEKVLPPPPRLSTRTQNYAHAILRKALADAVDDEIVKRNVCLLVDPPLIERVPTRTPTRKEAVALLQAAAGDRLWAYWLVVLALGLRRGEGLGMRWSLTDLDAKTVRLEKQVMRQSGELDEATGRRKGKLVEAGLKTKASQATMRLPDVVVLALRQHRKDQAAEQLAAEVWADPDLVFASTVGTPMEPRNVNRSWEAVCKKAGVGQFKLHALRHAAATFLFAEGVDPKVVQSTLRHTRLATTMDIYTGVLEEVRDGAASAMNDVLKSLTGEP
jgi:integrase